MNIVLSSLPRCVYIISTEDETYQEQPLRLLAAHSVASVEHAARVSGTIREGVLWDINAPVQGQRHGKPVTYITALLVHGGFDITQPMLVGAEALASSLGHACEIDPYPVDDPTTAPADGPGEPPETDNDSQKA